MPPVSPDPEIARAAEFVKKSWAAVAAPAAAPPKNACVPPAVPTGPAKISAAAPAARKPGWADPVNVAVGRNLVNQGGAASGINSAGRTETAFSFLTRRGITDIECHICKISKALAEYSNTQLTNFKDSICNVYAPKGRCKGKTATCKKCTNYVVTHLECYSCGDTKPLAKFMKAQRRNPDQARCKRCVQLDLETERLEDFNNFDDYDDGSDDGYDHSGDDVDTPRGSQVSTNENIFTARSDDEDEEDEEDGGVALDTGEKATGTPYPDNTVSPGAVGTAPVVSEWSAVTVAASSMYQRPKITRAPAFEKPNVGGWSKEKNKPPATNEWGPSVASQPRMVNKKPAKKNRNDSSDEDEDDGEEV